MEPKTGRRRPTAAMALAESSRRPFGLTIQGSRLLLAAAEGGTQHGWCSADPLCENKPPGSCFRGACGWPPAAAARRSPPPPACAQRARAPARACARELPCSAAKRRGAAALKRAERSVSASAALSRFGKHNHATANAHQGAKSCRDASCSEGAF